MISKIAFFFILITIVMDSCQEPDFSVKPPVIDYTYFPVDSGRWFEYAVKSIHIDAPVEVYDTQEYFIRHVFGGVYTDNSGDTLLQINRFYRKNKTDRWQPVNTWLAGIKNNMAVVDEENIRYIKLRFPLTVGKHWDGNAYNRTDTLKLYTYKIISLDEPFQLNHLNFDSVIYISQKTESTAISKLDFYERYAKHIGLVQKQEINIHSENLDDISVPIEKRVTQGYFFYQNLIGYGSY